jgi:hypothetical protein
MTNPAHQSSIASVSKLIVFNYHLQQQQEEHQIKQMRNPLSNSMPEKLHNIRVIIKISVINLSQLELSIIFTKLFTGMKDESTSLVNE